MTINHESITPPIGVLPARFRPAEGASNTPSFSLDGQWKFRYFPTVHTDLDPADPGDSWNEIGVPGHWQLAEAPHSWPYGVPEYNNVVYPFPVDPPHVPDENPTGEYRLKFRMPEGWPTVGRTVLRFEGVDSWFQVALNGTILAYSHGSRLPTEIDLTEHLSSGENILAVKVTKWSAMSYIEDQDQWWLSGIFRSVTISHRPEGGLDHLTVQSDYDHLTGMGTLRIDAPGLASASDVHVAVPELGIEVRGGETVRHSVEPWSAEVPRLYQVEVSGPSETVTLSVGFRTISIEDGVFKVNGAAVKLRGVNRHEFDPLRGRSVTPETMREDIRLMKQHNINAVRTAHQPHHPYFLELCDELGLYVIDESDLETHGFERHGDNWKGNPVDDPTWEAVLVDRVTRMVRRDAHHPSIILWSLGNEAGCGRNITAMAARVRQLDPSRPVHYEGDFSSEDVDVYSRMYATSEETELIGRGIESPLARADADARRRGMPFLQCEYAHAMGNGPGGLTDYDDIFDRYPRLMGGFIWEWIDHGILRTDPAGNEFHAYGGDFGEKFHDGTFIADGLMLPDRTPSPAMAEVAAVFAPIRIDLQSDNRSLLIRNRYAFRDTAHITFEWSLHQGENIISTGVLDGLNLAPGEQTVITVPADLELPAPSSNPTWWTVTAVQHAAGLGEDAWLQAPFSISRGQVMVQEPAPLSPARGTAQELSDGGFQVGHATFDRFGKLTTITGRTVHDFRIDAWRAPTDNDRRAGMWIGPSDEEIWTESGLNLLRERKISAELSESGSLVVSGRVAGPATVNGLRARYEWQPVGDEDNAIDLIVDITPEGRWGQNVARLGILLALDEDNASDAVVNWAGLGPNESYSDSKKAAHGGVWTHTVQELQTRYTHPQENGARRGVTDCEVAFTDGHTLRITSGETTLGPVSKTGFELTVRPWSDAALDVAKHPHELVPDSKMWFHIDAAQHGVGSAACGPGVLPNAQLHASTVHMRVRFTAN